MFIIILIDGVRINQTRWIKFERYQLHNTQLLTTLRSLHIRQYFDYYNVDKPLALLLCNQYISYQYIGMYSNDWSRYGIR